MANVFGKRGKSLIAGDADPYRLLNRMSSKKNPTFHVQASQSMADVHQGLL